MIVSRTPLRVSLFGGGTDLPGYYRRHGGAVLSFAITTYVHVAVAPRWDGALVLHHWEGERALRVADVRHPIIRECLRLAGVTGGLEISCLADVPVGGSGLGASSALTVGLLHALHALVGRSRGAAELAELACHVEIDRVGEPIGKQDQYAAAHGGLAEHRFHPDGSVTTDPVPLPPDRERDLLRHALVLYTGRTRRAAAILRDQQANVPASTPALHALRDSVRTGRALLEAGDFAGLGALLHRGWELKKTLSDRIHDAELDALYQRARAAGAHGGKLLGAGGGGFFLFLCPPRRRDAVRAALAECPELPLGVDHHGTTLLLGEPGVPARPVPLGSVG